MNSARVRQKGDGKHPEPEHQTQSVTTTLVDVGLVSSQQNFGGGAGGYT